MVLVRSRWKSHVGTSLGRSHRSACRTAAFALLPVFLTAACGSPLPTVLDNAEERLDIKENWLKTDHRKFHHILHYPRGTALHFPGYIVGIEKADQDEVRGPKHHPELLNGSDEDDGAEVRRKISRDPKTHVITHVVSYGRNDEQVKDYAVFGDRIKSCVVYSAIPPDGENGTVKADYLNATTPPPGKDGAHGIFEYCETKDDPEKQTGEASGPFEDSWRGVAGLRKGLEQDLKDGLKENPESIKERRGYSHILVFVMGWNTVQAEAVRNFNSMIGHLLDEVEARRMATKCNGKAEDIQAVCRFKPLFVGVTWPSDWEISPMLPVGPAFVRSISFPNKASDAKEVGMMWLRALLEKAVLPARASVYEDDADQPRLMVVGHSFGARAAVAGTLFPSALDTNHGLAAVLDGHWRFRPGDRLIGLQGAYRIDELFIDPKKPEMGLKENIAETGLRVFMTTSAFDEAVDTAFWGTYAGQAKAFDKVCGDNGTEAYRPFVGCRSAHYRSVPGRTADRLGYGVQRCTTVPPTRPLTNPSLAEPNGDDKPVTFVDASAVINCRAAFTGGGSHSDIYRRESARLLWDLMN